MTMSVEYAVPNRYDESEFAGSFAYRPLYPAPTIQVIWVPLPQGTSSDSPERVWQEPYVYDFMCTAVDGHAPVTAVGVIEHSSKSTRSAVSELRRTSGLTWDQLAQLFTVSRRSVHFWASGKPLNSAHEESLFKILEVVRWADRGDARSNRSAMFEVCDDNTPFDLLAAGKFDTAKNLLGPGPGRRRVELGQLSHAAKVDRRPLPPEELIDAVHDDVRHDVGRGRAARTVRNKLRGSAG